MAERVAVVGGGAVGVTAARDLAARGADVTLYERDELGSGASGRAAGIVYDAFAGERDAGIATRALDRFRSLAADGALAVTDRPYVWFAREGDDRHATAIAEQVERMQANGRDVDLLGPEAFADRVPALTVAVERAALAHDAATVDPAEYVAAMADRAREAGATVETDTPVRLLPGRGDTEEGDAEEGNAGPAVERPSGDRVAVDAVLVAAGAHTGRLCGAAGLPLAVKPYRVQALVTDGRESESAASDERESGPDPSCYDATRGCYARPWDRGLLVGDGTQEREFDPDDYDETADESFERESLAWVRETYRARSGDPNVARSWAGLCTATPDRDPLLGPVGGGVFVATGLHGHGFMRAPALGERIADQILGGDGIDGFDPRRFDGDEEFAVVEGMTLDDR